MSINRPVPGIESKLERFQQGNPLRVIDLFSGCGGLSLGFHAAGFEIAAAVENDPHAARSHSENFHAGSTAHGLAKDITETPPTLLAKQLGYRQAAEIADVVVGGPPCQAFARVGRSKLREVIGHPEAFTRDKRALLYLDYLKYVSQIKPLAVIMENVPDMLNHGGRNLAQEVCAALDELGYTCGYSLLNSVYYGVPQMRERMFLIAFAKELEIKPRFPATTHWIDLPAGYQGSRNVALRSVNDPSLFDGPINYHAPPNANKDNPAAVTAYDALSDLPVITSHLEGRLKRGARRLDEWVGYPESKNISQYANLMRNWKGFAAEEGIRDHAIRYLPRDYDIFRRMNPGDQYPQAHQHAVHMFEEALSIMAEAGQVPKEGSSEYNSLFKSVVPPYDPGKFPNKWRKMWRDQPARTLMAHLGKDSYSHIHYDSEQARTISVREAARLQSFPDGFRFSGTMNPAFRQIGNAVPPLLAKTVATEIQKSLKYAAQRKIVTQEIVAV